MKDATSILFASQLQVPVLVLVLSRHYKFEVLESKTSPSSTSITHVSYFVLVPIVLVGPPCLHRIQGAKTSLSLTMHITNFLDITFCLEHKVYNILLLRWSSFLQTLLALIIQRTFYESCQCT
jgi:hypothetical protein